MPNTPHHIPELLAPAGSPDALRAAVAAGADAVYLGVDRLNARRSAENFTVETLAEATRFAHLRGAKVYLTANVVVLPGEVEDALRLVDDAWTAGVDAVIVQDLGLLRVVRETLPHVRVHASTQMNIHNSESVRVLAGRGISRVTLARETSLGEIATLVAAGRESATEVESFVHGAICVCYSGQCLLSSLIGQRSANRGMCAQPCRLPYELTDSADAVIDTPGAHLLSPKDLAGVAVLPRYVEAGVAALKIEGRMKSPEYVALVTGVYRAALDRAAGSPESYEVRDGELAVLGEAFSRGFTEAYLVGERGNEMMSYRRPNNRGVLVGRIAATQGATATLSLDTALDAEDTIEVWTSRGRFAQPVGEMVFSGAAHRSAPGGETVTVTLIEPASVGDRVFRVRNAALSAAAGRTFSDAASSAPVTLDVAVRMVIGEPLSVEVRDASGRCGSALGPVVEPARTRPVSADDIAEHVGRFGGTAFVTGAWDIVLSPGAGIGFSVLHRVRREAIEDYEGVVLEQWAARRPTTPRVPKISGARRPSAARVPAVVAVVADLESAAACLEAGADSVQVPAWALGDAPVPDGVTPYLPRIAHDAELETHLALAYPGTRVVAGTIGHVARAARQGASVEAHWSLNALNAYAVAELADMGASFVWLSPELSVRQIAEVASSSAVPLGVAVAGRQEVMVTEHCILMSRGECSRACETCARRRQPHYLKDRKGYRFPVATDPTGRSHVYNAVPLDVTSSLAEIVEAGVAAVRLDLDLESPGQAAAHVAALRAALGITRSGRDLRSPDRGATTTGHFFRGVK